MRLGRFASLLIGMAFCAVVVANRPCIAGDANPDAPPGVPAKGPHDYRDKNFDYFVVGNPALPRAKHTETGYALFGGGGRVDSAFAFLARNAGGGHIVILRAVSDDSYDPTDGDYGEMFQSKWGPVESAETIVFHNRDASSDPRVVAALRGADGIFLAGGDQANYIKYWKGTPVQQALNDHVRNHRPIGGSSAGLAVLGRYAYTALDGGSMESKVALADPFNSGMTLDGDFLHCPGLEHVITDTHFSARSRLGRLIAFIARINHDDPAAKMFGIGVDEKSALLVDASGVGKLAEGSAASAWLVQEPDAPSVLAPGKPLSIDGVKLTRIDRNSSLDLKSATVQHAASETRIAIKDGTAAHDAMVSPMLMRDVVPTDED